MAIPSSYYGDMDEANDYFAARLFERVWSRANPDDRPKALRAATQIIDTLNYKGYKSTVYAVLEADASASNDAIREAELEQELEFPRGPDTEVPEAIRIACYEIAYSLLDGKDPEQELENLGITAHKYDKVQTAYQRDQIPIEHIINGVPNAQAWRLLRPFLRDSDAVKLTRIS
jgi:hypothetical protein